MSNYVDNTILKLKRIYSKDEFVSAVLKKLKDVEYENGILKSENSELEYLREQFLKQQNKIKHLENNIKIISKTKESKIILNLEIKELKKYINYLENEKHK